MTPDRIAQEVRKSIWPRTTSSARSQAFQSEDFDPELHNALWLGSHAWDGSKLIGSLPADLKPTLLGLWTQAFHAGMRYQSLRLIEETRARTSKARAARSPKITNEKYEAAKSKARSLKELAALLGVSMPTLRAYEDGAVAKAMGWDAPADLQVIRELGLRRSLGDIQEAVKPDSTKKEK